MNGIRLRQGFACGGCALLAIEPPAVGRVGRHSQRSSQWLGEPSNSYEATRGEGASTDDRRDTVVEG
jgi:hypothetical protein